MNDHSRIVNIGLVPLATAALFAGLAVPAVASVPSRVVLRADTDRDGRLTSADDAGRGTWTAARGAIMLPNLDDDRSRCPKAAPDGARLTDAALAACGDASDDVVNGPSDFADLARLEIPAMRNLSAAAHATLLPDAASRDEIRLFIERQGRFVALGADGTLRPDELRHGVRLAIEARDIVRDPAVWTGFTDLTLTVTDRGVSRADRDAARADRGVSRSDRVRLRVAPVLFQNDLMPLKRAVVADPRAPETLEGRKAPSTPIPGAAGYRRDLRRALDAEGLRQPFDESPSGGDRWMGDMYKTAYASMPGPGGAEHRIVVNLRAPAVTPDFPARDRPLRDASRPVFTKLRGPDVAGVQQFDATRVDRPDDNLYYGSAGSTGNFGTIPPYGAYPTGRIVYGGEGKFTPDPTFTRMLAAQGYQDPVVVDTSWLGVGHIDEFMHFVPARSARGWAMVVADPRLGLKLLKDLARTGGGSQRLVDGVDPSKTDKPGMTVAQALHDPSLLDGTRIAGRGVDKALRQLREQAGITGEDIVRVPVLFTKLALPAGYPRTDLTVAYLPDAANGIATGTTARGYLAPVQHAPKRAGKDVFEQATERALGKVGVHVRWIEDWDYAHHVGTAGGDVHCVTNVDRDLRGTTAWWRSPRP
ncbi:protein-arginine deiminase family protein [Actinomadura gamaensis]|uniref:Protein-arginine deiminase family protein n=1 Tax=Actinomadura gamaensis TaxID=1763541 RepID=A0ABV9U2V1_9ACTN